MHINLFLLIIIGIILIIFYFNLKSQLKGTLSRLDYKDNEIKDLKSKFDDKVLEKFSAFKKEELEFLKEKLEEIANSNALSKLEKWKMENETAIRRDAINRSQAVTLGKITEHIIPFHQTFPYNPKDLRFIGSPIDMIVFDGATEESEEVEVHILEIKTSKSALSNKQKLIKQAVLNGKVFWREFKYEEINNDSYSEKEIKTRIEQSYKQLSDLEIKKQDKIVVDSSNIYSVEYDPDTENLLIEFKNNAIYLYKNVPSFVYDDLMESSSKGKYFKEYISDRYVQEIIK